MNPHDELSDAEMAALVADLGGFDELSEADWTELFPTLDADGFPIDPSADPFLSVEALVPMPLTFSRLTDLTVRTVQSDEPEENVA